MRKVPDIAAAEIARLRKRGVELTDDDVVWLASLAREVERPGGMTPEAAGIRDGLRMADGTILYPLTIRASRWLERAGNLFSEFSDIYVVAYAMANREKLIMNEPAKAIVDNVTAWMLDLNCAPGEIEAAVSRMLDDDEPKKPDDSKSEPVEKVLALLEAATGIPSAEWERRSWDDVPLVYGGVIRYASMISMAGDDPNAAESKAALRRFALAIQEIINRDTDDV